MTITACAYVLGLRRLWAAAGAGSGVRYWQAGAFAAGWLVLALSLVSPLDRLGELLFSAHMVQHQAMMLVAAPLLVLGSPLFVMLWSLPPAWRRASGRIMRVGGLRPVLRALGRPWAAWWLYALALWAWHAPFLYAAALASYWIHSLQHASFLAAALLFWRAALENRGGVAGRGGAMLGVALTAAHSSILGALMTFAASPWYAHPVPVETFGLTPLQDQQLAGLIMWVPGGFAHLLAGAALAAMALSESETQARRQASRWAAPVDPARLDS
jgi:putative membrane protein